MKGCIFTAIACLLGGLFLTPLPALAQTPQPPKISDDAVNAVAKELYCPVCENIPLDVCPTQACAQWRDLIRQKLSQGWTTAQIREYFVEQYGDRVLAEPPMRGLNLAVYILPPLMLLAGVIILYRVLKRMRQKPAEITAQVAVNGHENDRYLARMEAELRRRQKNS